MVGLFKRSRVRSGVLSAALIAGMLGVTAPVAAYAETAAELDETASVGEELSSTPEAVSAEAEPLGVSARASLSEEPVLGSAPADAQKFEAELADGFEVVSASSASVSADDGYEEAPLIKVSGRVEVDPDVPDPFVHVFRHSAEQGCFGRTSLYLGGGMYEVGLWEPGDNGSTFFENCKAPGQYKVAYHAWATATAMSPFGYGSSFWAGEGKPSVSWADEAEEISIAPGDTIPGTDIDLIPNGKVQGKADVDLTTGETYWVWVIREGKTPAGVENMLWTRLSADGTFAAHVPPGKYVVALVQGEWMFSTGGEPEAEILGYYSEQQGFVSGVESASSILVQSKAVRSEVDLVKSSPEIARVSPGTVAIDGKPEVGSVLRATHADWLPSLLDFRYQWARNGVAIPGATEAEYRLGVADTNSAISVTITGSKAGYESARKSSASTALVVDTTPASLIVSVTGPDGKALPNAWIIMRSVGGTGGYFTGTTNGNGDLELKGIPRAVYEVTAYGTAGSRATDKQRVELLNPGQQARLSLRLSEPVLPSAVKLDGSWPEWGTMAISPGESHDVTVSGVPGGSARITVAPGSRVLELKEQPAGSGQYVGTIPAQVATPDDNGLIHLTAEVTGPDGAVEKTEFSLLYIDPSGNVVDRFGTPIAAADVLLKRSDSESGEFSPVADGDEGVMDPSVNVKNPSVTDAEGFFRWDVVPGWYKVQASKDGASIETSAMPVPPEQLNLVLAIDTGAQPKAIVAPKVSGKPVVGGTLVAETGEWPAVQGELAPIEVQSYQWLRDGEEILGALSKTYTPTAEDAGKKITVSVSFGRLVVAHAGSVNWWTEVLDAGTVPAADGGTDTPATGGTEGKGGAKPAVKAGLAKSGSDELVVGTVAGLLLLLAGAGVVGVARRKRASQ